MKNLIIILILASVSVFSQEQNRFTEQFEEADSVFWKSIEARIDSLPPARCFGVDSRLFKDLPNTGDLQVLPAIVNENELFSASGDIYSKDEVYFKIVAYHFEGFTLRIEKDSIHFDSTTPLAKSTRVFLKYLTDVLGTKIDSLENEIRILKARKEGD